MTTRRAIALSAAIAGSVLVPMAAAPPAHAVHCPPGSHLVTTAPIYFQLPGAPAAADVAFWVADPSGAACFWGTLSGYCPTVTVHDNSTVALVPRVYEGQSCVTGAVSFTTGAWAP